MSDAPMHQTCKQCGRLQRFEFSVSDDLWQSTGGGDGALCIECWLERVDASGRMTLTLEDFRFLGIVGNNIGGTLRDTAATSS